MGNTKKVSEVPWAELADGKPYARTDDACTTTLGSEESYPPLYRSMEIREFVIFLTYTTSWLCISTFCNIILFSLILYKHIFMDDDNAVFFSIVVVCDLVIIIDFISTLAFMYYKITATKRYVIPRNKVLMIMDLVSVVTVPFTLVPYDNYTSSFIFFINLLTLGFRNYRLLRLLNVLAKTAGHNTLAFLSFKYGMISFVICHVYACIWMAISCFEWDEDCDPTTSWPTSISSINEYNSSDQRFLNYIASMLYSINTYTTVGVFGASKGNDTEQFLTITLMLFGLYVANGLFIGDFTSVQLEGYRRHSVFSYKLNLINQYLSNEAITKKLKKKIKDFYIIFWKKRAALRTSKLFEKMLPGALKNRVLMDKYWDAMNTSNLLRNTSMAFKRALATKMFSEIYTTGEIIYGQDKVKNMLMYVAKGSVQVLSGDDTESSLLTLRMGSCLGDISLIYSLDSQVQVVSTSYSIIFCLKKGDLWETAHRLKLLKASDTIHGVAQRIMRVARIRQTYKARMSDLENLELLELTTYKQSWANKLVARNEAPAQEKISDFYDSQVIKGEAVSNLYVIAKEGFKSSDHDGIFLKTSFPWILRPYTQFTFSWECFFCVVISMVAIWYPWILMRNIESTQENIVFECLVCLIYSIDFIIRMFTAVDDDRGTYTDLNELFAIHCSKFVFLFDAVAIIPFEFVSDYGFLMLNRLFEIYRVITFIKKAENSFKVNVALVRSIKYVLYLLCLSYAIGVIYFMIACSGSVCKPNTWPEMYSRDHNMTASDVFEASIMSALLVTSGTGGRILYKRLIEMVILTVVCVVGALVFSYLVSDYSATLTLAGSSQAIYIETVEVIRNFFAETRMPESIRNRMNHYLEAQWMHNKGLPINVLLQDAPSYLYKEYQTAKFGGVFAKVPLFQELDDEVMNELTANCKTLFFPPNEFVTYSREVVKEMYIIEKGFCEVISPASGRIEKVIGQGTVFSAIDMVLELPGVFHVRTVTHVSVIKITLASLKRALTAEGKAILNNLVEETKQSFTVQRLFTESSARMVHKVVEEDDRSWVSTPLRTDPRRAEYMNSWKVFRCCRYFMLPYTIMPCGKFLAYYEIFRAICAFISAVFLPASFVYAYYIKKFWIIQWLLDISAYVDIYIRLHVCYYNNEGILVTHPRATAMNYLTGSFIVDLLACLPTDYFLTFFWKNNFETTAAYEKMCAILRLNRIFQIYRIPDAFTIFTRDLMKTVDSITLSFEMVILSLALLNFLCGIFMVSTYKLDKYTEAIVPEEGSWITYVSYPSIDLSLPINLYIVTFYFVCSQSIGIGYSDMFVSRRTEIILAIVIVIGGYLWFTYVLVIISNNKSIVNMNLTLYQKHMKQLIGFMKREKLDKDLQRKAIYHFEYVWQRSHGLRASTILAQCHLALSKDCALHLYENTLKEVLIFRDMVTSFYRVIGTNFEEQYYLTDYPIIRLNDIVSKIYIVHKGKVEICGPDGTRFTVLTKGGVFGNIDNTKCTRSMIFAKALGVVDMLVVQTNSLYSLINAYPVVINRMRKQILLENLSYIESKYEVDDDETLQDIYYITAGAKRKLTRHLKILCSAQLHLSFMIASYISFVLTTYQAAFKNTSYWFFGVVYFLDMVHITKMCLDFFTPYMDHMGEIVVSRKLIIKNYLKLDKFIVELAASLPTDLFYFIMPHYGGYGLALLRLNRCLRGVNVYTYFNIKRDQLNINVLLIKLSSIFISFSILIHAQGCVWYILACPFQCSNDSWIFDNTSVCYTPYICSLYCATSMATYSGFSPPHATTMQEIIYATILTIFNKFTLAVFIGYMTSIVHNVNAILVRYDHGIQKLKEHLKHSKASEPLVRKVLSYTCQLWDRSEGLQVPLYLTISPSFLQESIKIAAFGHHIYENEIFMDCHQDFLRQLIRLLRVTTLFEENIVCQQGDVNDTMYFVHHGVINVYKVTDTEEILVDELQELDSFGILQGIVPRTPHTHMYVSCSVTVVLSLTLSDWHQLLTFFPASKFTVFDRVQSIWSHV